MTTDYDRISADDLSCQTEDRLDHTEGEQTTYSVKGRAKRAKGAAKSSSAKTSSARTSSAQKSVRKTTKTRSLKTATKAQARAQAKQRAEDQLILRQQIETVFGDGADRFFLNRTGTGTTTVTDFDISEGDRVRVVTATGNEDTLAKLGLAVADNGAHANITSTDGSEVYMILENIDHALITDARFTTYFDIV